MSLSSRILLLRCFNKSKDKSRYLFFPVICTRSIRGHCLDDSFKGSNVTVESDTLQILSVWWWIEDALSNSKLSI